MGRGAAIRPRMGRKFARSGTPAAELESEIVRRLGAVDETTQETIREAIADALAGVGIDSMKAEEPFGAQTCVVG
jgi:hypothetical protein